MSLFLRTLLKCNKTNHACFYDFKHVLMFARCSAVATDTRETQCGMPAQMSEAKEAFRAALQVDHKDSLALQFLFGLLYNDVSVCISKAHTMT